MPTNFSATELALYRHCINEVLRGFHQPHMEETVGVSYAALMKEDAAYSEAKRSGGEVAIQVRPKVIAETIRELKREDFLARTGCTIEDGYLLLEKAQQA